jgi:hypothetical protein
VVIFYTSFSSILLNLISAENEDFRDEIAGSPQGSPPAADSVGCEAGRRTCSEHETGTEKLCEIKWDYHIVGTRA